MSNFLLNKIDEKYLINLTICPICNNEMRITPKLDRICDKDSFYIRPYECFYKTIYFGNREYGAYSYEDCILFIYKNNKYIDQKQFKNMQQLIDFISKTNIKNYIDKLEIFAQ